MCDGIAVKERGFFISGNMKVFPYFSQKPPPTTLLGNTFTIPSACLFKKQQPVSQILNCLLLKLEHMLKQLII